MGKLRRRKWTWPWSHMNIMPREEPWDTAATRMFAQSATAPMCLEPGHKGNTPPPRQSADESNLDSSALCV